MPIQEILKIMKYSDFLWWERKRIYYLCESGVEKKSEFYGEQEKEYIIFVSLFDLILTSL